MQAWIWTIIPSLFACYAANRHQRLIMFFELFIVLRSLSALWALGFASLCMAQLYNPLRVLSKTQPLAEAMGYWLWLLVIGDWVWSMGWGDAALPLIVPLPPTLYTTSDSDPVYYLIICQRQCFDAGAKQMQERYEVARVKTAGQFGRTSYPRPQGE